MALVLAGYGDIGARIARQTDLACVGINRSGRVVPALDAHVRILRCPLSELGQWVQPDDSLIWLAPPPAEGQADTTIRHALAQLGGLRKLVYLSTSGVYGDCQGRWVDESAPLAAQTPRARRRMDAEAAVQAWAAEHAVDWAIVRVPGIYGPGRLPRQRLEQGAPILAAQLAPWSNRIHAEDLARFLLLVLDRGQGIYNISDGQPGTITQYYLAVAKVLGIAAPPQVQDLDQLGPALASYMAESRRLDITRASQELGFVPGYPDVAAALPDCIRPDLSWEQPESA